MNKKDQESFILRGGKLLKRTFMLEEREAKKQIYPVKKIQEHHEIPLNRKKQPNVIEIRLDEQIYDEDYELFEYSGQAGFKGFEGTKLIFNYLSGSETITASEFSTIGYCFFENAMIVREDPFLDRFLKETGIQMHLTEFIGQWYDLYYQYLFLTNYIPFKEFKNIAKTLEARMDETISLEALVVMIRVKALTAGHTEFPYFDKFKTF